MIVFVMYKQNTEKLSIEQIGDQGLSSTGKSSSTEIGLVFNIQKFSLHDGPGIRDIVFFKGCPLSCQWCSNPESQSVSKELMFNRRKCLGSVECGLCLIECPKRAIQTNPDTTISINWDLCDHCGLCSKSCPSGAMEVTGKDMSVHEILEKVEEDGGFHFRSGGGITISGGEPLLQADFVSSLLKTCKERLIQTAVETTGYGSWKRLKKTIEFADLVLYDIKCINQEKHRVLTGVANDIIVENLQRLSDSYPHKTIIVRTPVIPDFNDNEKDITEIVEFLNGLQSIDSYELLPFHRLGIPKYHQLGKICQYRDIKPPETATMDRLNRIAAGFRSCYNK